MRSGVTLVLALALAAPACSKPITASQAAAVCRPVRTVEVKSRSHVNEGVKVSYKTDPPAGGDHWPSPARTGVYGADAPAPEQLVHNMEHGHVIFWIVPGSIPSSVVDGLVKIVAENPTRTVLTPHAFPKLPGVKVAFSAWGVIQLCTKGNATTVALARKFYATYAGKGPEGDLPGVPRGGTA
jgi:hypothetical protein